ncbi:hypothetical protein GTQ99_04725 [Kineococcus sp. T13]|uniref:hypothetical protein n=1 Tax=Kineococcus vitellinus TaxID=2696565 RepID=UPI0014132BCE|nr:hypothetical protein [Kineococcus vitellinus]NAZ74728.1 hypothetical protein [Kineococcus vitellinus]
MLLSLWLRATLHHDELALRMCDGTEHSRLPVDDGMDAAEALELMGAGALPVRLLCSHEALARYGYVRTSPWRYGPSADITSA